MSTYAQLEDVEDGWGQPIPVEQAHIFALLLDEAEVELAVAVGDLAERVTAELTTADRLKQAVVGMVLRVLRDADTRRQLLQGTSTGEERAALSTWLRVTRRERWLAGVTTGAASLSLSEVDTTLARPLLRPAGRYDAGGYFHPYYG